jgi:hypothetical protein
MKSSSLERIGHNRAPRDRRFWVALVILCAIGVATAARRIVVLASELPAGVFEVAGLDAHFAAKMRMTLLHIVPGLLFVLLVPLQFVRTLRLRHPQLHRWTGRLIMGLGIVIGTSALLLSASPVGGVVEGTATTCFGLLFLLSLGKAWLHIRNGRTGLHREWVTRMVAVALGVAMTRPIMAVFFAISRLTGLTPEQFFGPAMWLGFVSTCLAGEAWIRYARSQTAHNCGETYLLCYGDTRESTLGSTDRAGFWHTDDKGEMSYERTDSIIVGG